MRDTRSWSRASVLALVLLIVGVAAALLVAVAWPLDRPPSYVGFLPAAESPTSDARWTRAYSKIEIPDDGWRPLRIRLQLRASPEASARQAPAPLAPPPQAPAPQAPAGRTPFTFLVADRPVHHGRAGAAWEPHDLAIDPPLTRTPYVSLQIQAEVGAAHIAGVGIRELRVSPILVSARGGTIAAIGAGLGLVLWLLLPFGAPGRRLLARAAPAIARPIAGVPGLGLLLFVGGLLIADDVWWWPPFPPIDLPSFYWAARVTFVEGQSPYSAEALARGAALLRVEHIFPYLSPPPSLLLFAPLAAASFDTAAVAIVRLNSALFVIGLVLIFRYLLRVTAASPLAIVALVYALSFWPVYNTIAHGQVNLLVMVCLVLAWWLIREGHPPVAAAVPLALAIGFKTYPVLWLPYLAITRRYRALAWTTGALIALTLAALVILPRSAWTDWFARVAPTLGYGQPPWQLFEPARVYNQSLNGFVARLFGPASLTEVPWPWPGMARVVTYVLAAAAIAWHFAVCWRTRARLGPVVQDCHWAATLFLMFLLAPFSWDHSLVMLLPGCLVVLRHAWDQEVSPWSRAIAGVALILLAWVLAPESPAYREGWRTLLVSTKFFAVLALWAITLSWLWASAGASPGPAAVPTRAAHGASGSVGGPAL